MPRPVMAERVVFHQGDDVTPDKNAAPDHGQVKCGILKLACPHSATELNKMLAGAARQAKYLMGSLMLCAVGGDDEDRAACDRQLPQIASNRPASRGVSLPSPSLSGNPENCFY